MTRKNKEHLILLLLSLSPLLIYINPIDFESMGANEILFARKSLYQLFFEMKWGNQSPFYFLFLKVFSLIFGEGYIASRIFNIIPQVLCTILLFNVTKMITKEKVTPWLCVLLFVTTPMHVRFCHSGRMYPFLMLFSLINMACTIQYLNSRKITYLIILTLTSILSGYNHYMGFITIGFSYLLIFVSFFPKSLTKNNFKQAFKSSEFINFFLIGLTGLIALVPQIIRIFHYLSSGYSSKNDYSLPNTFVECALYVLKKNLLFPYAMNLSPLKEIIFLVTLIAVVTFFLFAILKSKIHDKLNRIFLIAIPLSLLILLALYYQQSYIKHIQLGIVIFFLVFFLAGLFTSKIQHAVIGTFWTAIPFILLTILALYYDVRFRNFTFSIPIFCLFFASGIVNLSNILKIKIKFLLPVLAVFVLCNLMLSENTYQYKNHQWNQLLTALSKFKGKETTDYYIIPRFTHSSIEVTNDLMKTGLNLGRLAKIERPNRNFLNNSITKKRNVVFIRRSGVVTNDLYHWKNTLRENGYTKEALVVKNIVTEIYSLKGESKLFNYKFTCQSKTGCATVQSIINEHASKADENQDLYDISKLKVSKLLSNGIIAEPQAFINNPLNPELGMWQTGLNNRWQTIKLLNEELSDTKKRSIYFQPNAGEELIVSWPKRKFSDALIITYGIMKNSAFRDFYPILSSLYMDQELISKFGVLNNGKWNKICINTKQFKNKKHMLSLALKTRKIQGRNLLINFEEASSCKDDIAIKLDEKGISHHVGKLKIKSLSPNNSKSVTHKSFYNIKYSANIMHAYRGPNEVGMLRNRWVVGDVIWQSVGETSQLINGKPFNGLWLHPHRNYKLIVESNKIKSSKNLIAVFGFTDASIDNSIAYNYMHPVDISIFINDKLHTSRRLERKRGLTKIKLNSDENVNSISIHISAENDKWGHLIGNVYPAKK